VTFDRETHDTSRRFSFDRDDNSSLADRSSISQQANVHRVQKLGPYSVVYTTWFDGHVCPCQHRTSSVVVDRAPATVKDLRHCHFIDVFRSANTYDSLNFYSCLQLLIQCSTTAHSNATTSHEKRAVATVVTSRRCADVSSTIDRHVDNAHRRSLSLVKTSQVNLSSIGSMPRHHTSTESDNDVIIYFSVNFDIHRMCLKNIAFV
jgi:hypothetical protein